MRSVWTVEKLVPGGEGFARLEDGRPGFVPGAFPGDVVRPERLVEKRELVRAESWKLVTPSPDRVTPECPIAAQCGGCDWMGLSRGAELREKLELVREALERTGGLRALPELTLVTAGESLGYRARLRLHVDERGKLGLFERHSHALVELGACPVSDPEINRGLSHIRELCKRHPGRFGAFTELELRSAPSDPTLGIRLTPRALPLPKQAEPLLAELEAHAAVSVPGTERARNDVQRWNLPGGVELAAPIDAFTQVNPEVNAKLVAAVVSGAEARGIKSTLELYAGAGNFSFPLAALGIRVVAVEREGAAIRAAREASARAKVEAVEFIAGDVSKVLRGLVQRALAFDLVLLDPPRSGAKDALVSVIRLAPQFVAMCACDPVTLARDLRVLVDAGYVPEAITAFDMFPRTHHVEALCWLKRGPTIPG
jgi:23S rRNA (uracil1939-C5)-methyltransferase